VEHSLFNDRVKGTRCPMCNSFLKLYKRKLTSSMAYALILFYRSGNQDWIHAENYFKGLDNIPYSIRGDFPKLRFWGLIEKKSGEKDDKNPDNGYYRISDSGIAFVKYKVKVPVHALIYKNVVEDFSSELMDIKQALGKKFRYDETVYNEDKNN
jgi:hypothetical protein